MTVLARTTCAVAATLSALAVAGCGATVPDSLVQQTGAHGDALEAVYSLYTSDPLAKASTRDLKDINDALAANDLKKATPGDVRRAQAEIRSRIDDVDEFVDEIRTANRKLKQTPLPDFASGFEADPANVAFADAYTDTTRTIERYTTKDLAAAPVALTALERYLDFLEQWEEFLIDDDIKGLVSAGEKSDAAYKKLTAVSRRTKARVNLNKMISPLVDKMAQAASESAQAADLVDKVKKQYPENFLSKHLVEQ